MDSRERIQRIFAREKADRCGFWLGQPHEETWQNYFRYFNTPTTPEAERRNLPVPWDAPAQEALRRHLGDDLRWVPPYDWYKHPQGKPMWQNQHDQSKGYASAGVFADCEDPADVEKIEWPNPDYCDFNQTIADLKQTGPYYRLGGCWCPFFHNVADFFGMENYFLKMYTNPEVVDAVTRHICEFYLEANERLFAQAKNEVDGFFFGNDFGTQIDLFISPGSFDRFVMPWFKKFTDQGHAHGYQVVLHSCGSIFKVIDCLIASGVDALHPLQAKAANMDAATLAKNFGNKISFMGGIDTQDLLVNGSPQQITAEVARVRSFLGPHLVISPSHEAVLPNVPPENIAAMAHAVRGGY